jgi:hypothetical protein
MKRPDERKLLQGLEVKKLFATLSPIQNDTTSSAAA